MVMSSATAVLVSLLAQAAPTPGEMGMSVAPLVDRVKASVVTIQSTKVIPRVVNEDPMMQYFRERFGLGRAPSRPGGGHVADVGVRVGAASGRIRRRDGDVRIQNADTKSVLGSGGRVARDALRVVGLCEASVRYTTSGQRGGEADAVVAGAAGAPAWLGGKIAGRSE